MTVIRCSSRSGSFQIVKKIPGMSMGDPETLSLLLQYGAENLPADAGISRGCAPLIPQSARQTMRPHAAFLLF